MKPLISFVVPVYRAEKYLKKCVDSILKQNCENMEIILVDDESPDTSGEICDEYAKMDQRIKVIHQKNTGQGRARNTGTENAAGKWLMFIDDDDWLEEGTLSGYFSYLKDDDTDILVFAKRDVFENHSEERKLSDFPDMLVFETENDRRELQLNMLNFFRPYKFPLYKIPFVTPWGKFIRRTFWEENKLGFIDGYGEDRPCLLKAYSHARKVLFFNEIIYNYRIHQSTMRRYLPDAIDRYQLSLKTIHDFVDKYHHGDEEFLKELYHTDAAYFSYAIVQDYCHVDNPESYMERRRRYFKALQKPVFRKAVFKADKSCLPFDRKVLLLLVMTRSFMLLDLVNKLNFYRRK